MQLNFVLGGLKGRMAQLRGANLADNKCMLPAATAWTLSDTPITAYVYLSVTAPYSDIAHGNNKNSYAMRA